MDLRRPEKETTCSDLRKATAAIGTHARDKDAIVATMALCEAAAYYKTKGMNLWDAMIELYERYGYYKDDIQSITLKGIEGLAKSPGDSGDAA